MSAKAEERKDQKELATCGCPHVSEGRNSGVDVLCLCVWSSCLMYPGFTATAGRNGMRELKSWPIWMVPMWALLRRLGVVGFGAWVLLEGYRLWEVGVIATEHDTSASYMYHSALTFRDNEISLMGRLFQPWQQLPFSFRNISVKHCYFSVFLQRTSSYISCSWYVIYEV